MNEISQAFMRYSAHDEICFLPFKIEEFRLSDGLSYYMTEAEAAKVQKVQKTAAKKAPKL